MAGPDTEASRKPSRSALSVLGPHNGESPTHCGRLIAEQAAQIEALQAQQMRLRAELIIRVTALQFEREERARLETMAPGLPRRAVLARQVEQLKLRLETLLRDRTHWRRGGERQRDAPPPPGPLPGDRALCDGPAAASASALEGRGPDPAPGTGPRRSGNGSNAHEQCVLEAELLICRTGCISQGDYWRVQDHCRRTGKACLLIDEHQAIHVMRQGNGVVVQARPVRPFEA